MANYMNGFAKILLLDEQGQNMANSYTLYGSAYCEVKFEKSLLYFQSAVIFLECALII